MKSNRNPCNGCRHWSHLDRKEDGTRRCLSEEAVAALGTPYTALSCARYQLGLAPDYIDTAQAAWFSYRARVVPQNAPDIQVNETRLAFMGGFNAAVGSMAQAADKGEQALADFLKIQRVEFQKWIEAETAGKTLG